MQFKLYLAGGLFNAGERLHNLMLEKQLQRLGYDVILPQREALRFFDGKFFDVPGIVYDCRVSCENPEVICVANVDGADSDSGTCVEYGIATTANKRAIAYRTDFRTALAQELGWNAMLRGPETKQIYQPSFFTDLAEAESFYEELARQIHEAVLSLSV